MPAFLIALLISLALIAIPVFWAVGAYNGLVKLRNQAQSAGKLTASDPANMMAMKNMMGAESGLSGALGRLMAVAEAYPDLKANMFNFEEAALFEITDETEKEAPEVSFG